MAHCLGVANTWSASACGQPVVERPRQIHSRYRSVRCQLGPRRITPPPAPSSGPRIQPVRQPTALDRLSVTSVLSAASNLRTREDRRAPADNAEFLQGGCACTTVENVGLAVPPSSDRATRLRR